MPGATVLTGQHFMSCQAIFDIPSDCNVEQRAVERIPSAPKSNCYFILKLGRDLMDYDAASANKLKIQDRLRDGTGGWDETTCCNFNFYKNL